MNKAKLGHVIGVCGLALGALGAVATPAIISPTRSTVTASTVADDTTARSITIHKFSQSTTPSTGDRTGTTADEALVPSDAKPLSGISFKITKITKNDGKTLSATDEDSFTRTSTTQTVTTGDNGVVSAALGTGTSADGYYIVEEQASDAVKKTADPFIVHVPLTTTDATTGDQSLTYDINVYPKNEVDTDSMKLNPTKTLIGADGKETSKESVKAGSEVSWNLTIDRPSDIHGSGVDDEGTTSESTPDGNGNTVTTTTKTWTSYASELEMVDKLDTTKMQYIGIDKVVISSPSTNDPTTMVATELTKDTDYTVDTADSGDTKTVTVKLTDAGILKLAQAPKGSKVVATLKTKVLADDDAKVVNTFSTNYKGTMTPGSDTSTETVPDGTEPTVEYGNIDAKKTKEDGTTAVAKATFKLYPTEADAKAGTNAITDADGNDLTAVSDDQGQVEFRGLEVDLDADTPNTRDYYLVETDAPVGYDLNGEVFKVTAAQDTSVDATIKDPDNMLPNLPLTGSQGRILFYALTTMLIVVGAGGVYIIKKRQQA